MSKTVVIHQPDFLPYLGFFHRFLAADLYIALDHVQFVHSNRGWTHRDKIKTPRGAQWLTLSVRKAPFGAPINSIEFADGDWAQGNLNLLRENYRSAPHFSEIFPAIEDLYSHRGSSMAEFTLASIGMLSRFFNVALPQVKSSELEPVGAKNDLLVDLLRKVGATHYLSGTGAKAYFDPAPFAAAGIEVVWQDFKHPVYPQLHGEFVPFLSSVDVLFNCGAARAREILRSC